jgi:hypothetical protein
VRENVEKALQLDFFIFSLTHTLFKAKIHISGAKREGNSVTVQLSEYVV